MNKVVEILMKRDGMSKTEAEDILKDVRNMLEKCNYSLKESEDIIANELGLEADYIFDILF